jgi:hypothetical protein
VYISSLVFGLIALLVVKPFVFISADVVITFTVVVVAALSTSFLDAFFRIDIFVRRVHGEACFSGREDMFIRVVNDDCSIRFQLHHTFELHFHRGFSGFEETPHVDSPNATVIIHIADWSEVLF